MSNSERLITVEAGFQYAVNIAYDLHNDKKIAGFIPTKSAMNFILEVLKSTRRDTSFSTERSRVLVAPYGRGKSHLVLTLLTLLNHRPLEDFKSLGTLLASNKELAEEINSYYENNRKLLPVVITGANSISQSFLLALERALRDNNLTNLMPETNYLAAIRTINRWETDYSSTFENFISKINTTPENFIAGLKAYNLSYYEEFEQLYPELTAGSQFNPFLGFDVVELYKSVLLALKNTDYTGMFVVYDEFSKFLETNIASTSARDMKTLQDFAEMCNRSEENVCEILLIAHKEIENYIDKLPKKSTDGWLAVSNRFRHIRLSSDFNESYEIMEAVIKHNPKKWSIFLEKNDEKLKSLVNFYQNKPLFRELNQLEINKLVYGCYPLHPLTSFILPRLSERVAQNERTLFTFLAAEGNFTLNSFLRKLDETKFLLLTPDFIFDYFKPLLAKENSIIHNQYVMAEKILASIEEDLLASKIVKSLALIYMLEQFERLPPTKTIIAECLEYEYQPEQIKMAITKLIEQKYILYLKRSNGYLALKESSGVDVVAKINDLAAKYMVKSTAELAGSLNFNYFIYPSHYNDEREMTRYFSVEFMDAGELTLAENLAEMAELSKSDGVLYAIVAANEDELIKAREVLLNVKASQIIFAVPRNILSVQKDLAKLYAAKVLRDEANEDRVLAHEYAIIYDDLYELVSGKLSDYINPERRASDYYYKGEKIKLLRRASLSKLTSKICDDIYPYTPVINNEVINKNSISLPAVKSRLRVVAGILRHEVEPNLGLIGYGQDISIMRSTLVRTGILTENNGTLDLVLTTGDKNLDYVLSLINDFILKADENNRLSFKVLYDELMGLDKGVGIRRGIIPILVAVVARRYADNIIIYEQNKEITLTAEALQQINDNPEHFFLKRLNQSKDRDEFIKALSLGFGKSDIASYKNLYIAMNAWFLALPQYSRDRKKNLPSENIRLMRAFRNETNASQLLFHELPTIFSCAINKKLADKVLAAKADYDNALLELEKNIKTELYKLFGEKKNKRASLIAVLLDWCDTLDPAVFNTVFADDTAKFLALCRANISEQEMIAKIARLSTGLRLIDWSDDSIKNFINAVAGYKSTAENFKEKAEKNTAKSNADMYSITFIDSNGKATQKNFARTNYSNRAKLLLNNLLANVESMGTAISEAEKRQVIIEVLEKFC